MGNHGCIIRIQPKSLHSKANDRHPEAPTFVILIFKGEKQTNKQTGFTLMRSSPFGIEAGLVSLPSLRN